MNPTKRSNKTDAGNGSNGICGVSTPPACRRLIHVVRPTSMLLWLQRWLQPIHSRSAEVLSVEADGQPVLNSDSEWIVEIKGSPVALLSHPQWVEMFWMSYEMTPLTEDPEIVAKLHDVEFWRVCESLEVSFRHRASSIVASHAFPGLAPFPEPGRLVMRGLYLPT